MATGERLRCRRSIYWWCHLSGTANSRRNVNGPTCRVTNAPNTVRLAWVESWRQDNRCARRVTSASGSVYFKCRTTAHWAAVADAASEPIT
jgi:hypothetical protein